MGGSEAGGEDSGEDGALESGEGGAEQRSATSSQS